MSELALSENVQIALITAAAAFIGAIAGAIGTYIAARSNIKKENSHLMFETRLRLYSAYIDAVTEYLKHFDQDDCYADVLTSVRNVRLVCTNRLTPLIENMSLLLRNAAPGEPPPEGFKELNHQLICQMNCDMDIVKPLNKSRKHKR